MRVGGDSSTVHILNQTQDTVNFQDVYGINANAFHVLYSAVHKYEQGSSRSSQSEPSTFSLSIYSDSSIRIRYHSLLSKQLPSDVFGLWGARVSNHKSQGSKYHEEIISHDLLQSGNDVTLCYISTVVCGSNAMAISGSIVNLTVIGSAPSCLALGENLWVKCVWLGHGSAYETTASFVSNSQSTTLSCPVPHLNLDDDSLISLDLVYETSKSSLVSSLENAEKSITTKIYDQQSDQVSTTHVMLRYFHSSPNNLSYGCNPLVASSDTCDLCGVCGGNNTSIDCHGDCFGSAYIDNCGVCAGGASGIYPDSTCDLSDPINKWENGDVLDTLSKTILLLTMMICMTFIFSACMRIIRASFIGPEEDRHDGFFGLALPHLPNRREAGLNNFEIDALGQIQFVKDIKEIPCDGGNDIESSPSSCILTIPLQPNLECSICLIEFNENDRCRQLPCDHIFHTQCIDQWFTVSVLCPMCKRNIRAILHGEEDIGLRTTTSSQQAQLSPTNQVPHPSSAVSDYLTAVSPMSQTIEMTELSSNSSSSTSSTTRTQGEQEGESVALITPFG